MMRSPVTRYGMGRRLSPDPGAGSHTLRRAARQLGIVGRKSKTWSIFFKPLDQGPTGTCVGHGLKHAMLAAPVIQTRPDSEPTAFTIYDEAVLLDEWPDNDGDRYAGTSVRAGLMALRKRGYINGYGWAHSVRDVADWLAGVDANGKHVGGPVVLGIAWYQSMFEPDPEGYIHITPTSEVAGGHCICLIGWDERRVAARAIQSWGSGWGQNGRCWIDSETLGRLLKEDGEASAFAELRLVKG